MTTSDERTALLNLALVLRRAGFKVRREDCGHTIRVWGRGIRGAAQTTQRASYRTLAGRFAADNSRAFDKWITASLVMRLPCDLARLLPALERLATEEGERLSNGFVCDRPGENPFPYEVGLPVTG